LYFIVDGLIHQNLTCVLLKTALVTNIQLRRENAAPHLPELQQGISVVLVFFLVNAFISSQLKFSTFQNSQSVKPTTTKKGKGSTSSSSGSTR
jgi:hypothetical protein